MVSLFRSCTPHIVQERRRFENAPSVLASVKDPISNQPIVELQGQLSDEPRVLNVRIKERRPGAKPGRGCILQRAVLRQFRAPYAPQGVWPSHPVTVFCQPLLAFFSDLLLPVQALLVAKIAAPSQDRPEHIQVVHFTQQVLQLPQILAPPLMALGEEILHLN